MAFAGPLLTARPFTTRTYLPRIYVVRAIASRYPMQNPLRYFRLPALALSLLLAACQRETVAPAPNSPSATTLPEHLTLGNPSGATADVAQPTNYLMLKPQYALSYHRDRGIPNWVSWHLSNDWRGSAARQDDFRPDDTLPTGW